MQTNWTVIILVSIVLIVVLLFIIIRNRKDRKEFERQQNLDYHKPKEHEEENDMDELKNN